MTADKRSVATDALEVLGTVITDKKVGRDAVHLACMPVKIADDILPPGAHVGFLPNGTVSRFAPTAVGIIDPFIEHAVKRGDEVLLIIYPRKIESLRHVWSHPGIPDEIVNPEIVTLRKELQKQLTEVDRVNGERERMAAKLNELEEKSVPLKLSKAEKEKEAAIEKARTALRAIATRVTDSRFGALELLIEGMDDGYIQDGGRFEGWGQPNIPEEAWALFEIVHGRRANKDPRDGGDPVYFSCSC